MWTDVSCTLSIMKLDAVTQTATSILCYRYSSEGSWRVWSYGIDIKTLKTNPCTRNSRYRRCVWLRRGSDPRSCLTVEDNQRACSPHAGKILWLYYSLQTWLILADIFSVITNKLHQNSGNFRCNLQTGMIIWFNNES